MNVTALEILSEAVITQIRDSFIQSINTGAPGVVDYQNIASRFISQYGEKFNSNQWLSLAYAIAEIIAEVENEQVN